MLEFLFPILLGTIICYDDLKKGIIKNKYILFLIIYGILFQLVLGTDMSIFLKFALFSFFISFLFWYIGLWPAGDGKLFFAFSLLFPASFYLKQSLLMDYLVNIFVPIFLFISFYLLIKSKKKIIKDSLKYAFRPYNFLLISIIFIGFASLLARLFTLFGIEANFLVYIFFMFVAYEILRRFFTAKIEMFFVLLAIIRIAIDYNSIYTISFIYKFSLTILTFIFFRFFILKLAFNAYTKKIKLKNLKPGMILAEGIVEKKDKIQKISFFQSSLIQTLQQRKEKYIHNIGYLTKSDIEKIKELKKKNKIKFNEILIYQKQPFAIFLLLGYIITLIFQGSFVNWLRIII